jgi:hypothetical protein
LLGRCGHTAAEVWDLDRFVCRIERSDIVSTGCACGAGAPYFGPTTNP